MPQTDFDRTIALAGLFQSAQCVRDIARTGDANVKAVETSIGSLFQFDAESSDAVFGSIERLHLGLDCVANQLLRPHDMEVTRYVLSLLVLERKLGQRDDMREYMGKAMSDVGDKLNYFSYTHENTIAALADIYAQTISHLVPRIMVSGEQLHLTQADNANKIRALLLAGVRAAILWRQSGGSKMTLVFRRKALVSEAKRVLDAIASTMGTTAGPKLNNLD